MIGSQQPCEWTTTLLWTCDWRPYVAVVTITVLVAIELVPCGNANIREVFGFSKVNNACLTLFISLWPSTLNF
jgi:hypothetical protein